MKKTLVALFSIPFLMYGQNNLAGLRADVEAMQEQQKMLYAEIMRLRQEMAQKDQRINKAIEMIDALDRRMAEKDVAWKKDITHILTILDKEHDARVKDTQRLQSATRNANASLPAGEYTTITIEAGDTLGAIARAAGVSVQQLKEINNLSSNTIQVGQKLKVPVKKGK